MEKETLSNIINQVRYNCHISDAKFGGMFSTCGLLLRLRDLYRWEAGLEPWSGVDSALIGKWLEEREKQWWEVVEEEFKQIEIDGRWYDPFDVNNINQFLKPHGLLYGAGYAGGMKPSFFLAKLEEEREIEGCVVHILGKELARDLLAVPAQLQDREVFVRKEVIRFFIWDKVHSIEKSGREAISYALYQYGFSREDVKDLKTKSQKLQKKLDEIVKGELDAYIYHEIGEANEDVFDKQMWKEIINTFPHSRIEVFVRVIKDILADTNERGRLKFIINNARVSSFCFFIAFLSGFLKLFFPEIKQTFKEFVESQDWELIERLRQNKYKEIKVYAEKLMELFGQIETQGKDWVQKKIETELIKPLGV